MRGLEERPGVRKVNEREKKETLGAVMTLSWAMWGDGEEKGEGGGARRPNIQREWVTKMAGLERE